MTINIQKSENPDDGFAYVVTNDQTNESTWIVETIDGWDVLAHVRDPFEPYDVWLDSIEICSNLDDAILLAMEAVDNERI
jgi:hypothetical protein